MMWWMCSYMFCHIDVCEVTDELEAYERGYLLNTGDNTLYICMLSHVE